MSSPKKKQKINIKSETSVEKINREENEANSAISELITNIQTLTDRKNPLLTSVRSPKLLIRGLTELQSLIEMVDIKHAIVDQIKFLIVNHARKTSTDEKSKFDGHMLHSVISGNPGCGKTTVAKNLSKIWMSLGFVNKKDTKPDSTKVPNSITPSILAKIIFEYRNRILELEDNYQKDHQKLEKIKASLGSYYDELSNIRRKCRNFKTKHHNQEFNSLISDVRTLKTKFDDIILEADSETRPSEIITTESQDPYENTDPTFIVASRAELVSEYVGQTAIKTKKVLESARGGVLFIDEAYSICLFDSGNKDKFGEECLVTINEFMSLYPDEIIIIFAGYKNMLMNSIFKAQPGLLRRCAYFFEIKDYSYNGLSKIFKRQLAKHSWYISPDVDIEKILTENKDIIKDSAGFTEKLSMYVKISYGNSKFTTTLNPPSEEPILYDSIITSDMLESAIKKLRSQSEDKDKDKDKTIPPPWMYL